MEFIVCYDLEEFEKYYKTLTDLHQYYRARKVEDTTFSEIGSDERTHIESDPDHLIVWVEHGVIIGHCVWHETSTEEHSPGNPRSDDEIEFYRGLFEGKRTNLVEMHEVWLKSEFRGSGYGEQFFSFFEEFARKRDFEGLVYYTDNQAAIKLCQRRGYREAFLEPDGWYVFACLL